MAELNPPKKKLIIVTGPTAVGKTALAIRLAQKFNTEIISFDSRQFYREMKIGTARPTDEELTEAKHHFIGHLSIHDHYTSGLFETDALEKLNQIFKMHDYCIAVGGSGLYINALCYGIDNIPADETVRNQLIQRWQDEGLEKLQSEVKMCDPEFYENADMQNPRRVIRALEVFTITGSPYSAFRLNEAKPRSFDTFWIGLNMDKDQLYDRINTRVDTMMHEGLLDEVKLLYQFNHLKSLRTVGYTELFNHLSGNDSLERAVELIKRNTRIYARKQISWFKRNPEICWFDTLNQEPIFQALEQKLVK
ncbi:MAG: tRNA (adenosine(37)-N6)-dimethylallyltransferase MiaA [Crocinitomicaceae bacterium]|nr:tRNA (adenosine(37)-N6)-dimethylallyltransferase MiaA [Crocinitomicaceae bacterium]